MNPIKVAYHIVTRRTNIPAAAAIVKSPLYFASNAIIVPSVTMNPPGMKNLEILSIHYFELL